MQTNRSTFNILFYLNTSKMKKSGKCPVMGRISVDGKSTAFSTGIDMEPENWDAKAGMAKGKSQEAALANRQIEKFKTGLNSHYKSMVENQGYITAELLKNALQGIGLNQNTVMQEFSELVEEKRKSVGIRIVASSYGIYPAAYRCFKAFLKQRYGVDDIPFGKVNIAMIEEYACFLKIGLRLAPRTAKSTVKPLRTAVMRAFNRGLIHNDPFLEYAPEKILQNPRWLSHDEIDRLMKAELKSPVQRFIRDMFVFSMFTGISYSDLKNLKHENIKIQEDGSLWIVLNRQKTKTASYIPLLPVPKIILDKYGDTKFAGTDGKVFKITSSTSVNGHLKTLAKAAGIDKCLTFHMSRHSFATSICLSQGIPIESLSRMMGHLS
ncbi:MAG: site-specific integrase, partial [Candidatus Symbiothrix sp.]|nr:site-specific integrase [Candidatus Symbiothrix sp.]